MATERIVIGRVLAGELEPGAILVPTAEWISPYVGISEEEQAQIMSQVEPPSIPIVRE